MTPFEYLSVLVSIIVGLAITQLLSGAARLIQLRRRVRPHAATLCWMVFLFLLDTQIWWAAFFRRYSQDWNFFLFLFYLLMPILAFLLSYLVLPELGDEDEIDLAANFEGNRPWFFGLAALMLATSLAEQAVRVGSLPMDVDVAFRVVFLALSLACAGIRSARFQLWAAAAALALMCSYVAMVFRHLH
ncbi:MAG TPA: hypothetical protein VM619_04880 [Luteimonas sp.]|nr:hypothetical protein [Luteimonas sp.]